MAVEGSENLKKAFAELGDMSSAEWRRTLRSAVTTPAKAVVQQATINIRKISPGIAEEHKTYLGRLVAAGFASRNIRMKIKLNLKKGIATAFIGVAKEAFYALSFFELGVPSRRIARDPWLTVALHSKEKVSVEEVGSAILKCLTSIAKRRNRTSPSSGSVK